MASSSSTRRRSYDVFLSFRGSEVRNNFLGHLYTALNKRGINTFIDNEELRKGDQISPALMEAIEESRIAIVVFSEDYASSPLCLEEMAKIMECKEQRHLMVFPVFYKVEPREVRTPGNGKGERQSYGEAMAEHEVKFGRDSEKIKRWRRALFCASSLPGWHFADGYEPGLIQDIVQKISTQLDRMPLDVAKYPIGIDSQVQELKTILNPQSKDDVQKNAIKAKGLERVMPEELYIGPDAFMKMKNLRLLILRNVNNSFQGPIHLPNELRWFEWPHCTSTPKFSPGQKELVGLDLRNSKIGVELEQFKDFGKLRFINFSECEWLVRMPDLHCTPYLEQLDLHGCKNLKHAGKSLAHHDRLRLLNLSGCSELYDFPDVLQSKNLELLNLNHCSKLQKFPDIPDKMEKLQGLYLIGTSIKELPKSIENLVSLEEMDLRYCKKLAILPSSIYRLSNLETLTLEGCSKLSGFPKKEDPSNSHMAWGFPKLYVLNLRGCNLSEVDFLENHSCFPLLRALYLLGNNITNLPTCGQLHNLLWFDVSYCLQLQDIPQNPSQLSHLWSIGCESVSKFAPDKCDVEG